MNQALSVQANMGFGFHGFLRLIPAIFGLALKISFVILFITGPWALPSVSGLQEVFLHAPPRQTGFSLLRRALRSLSCVFTRAVAFDFQPVKNQALRSSF